MKKPKAKPVPTDPVMAFAYFVGKCAEGCGKELMASGKTETEARNAIIHYFLDFAAGEACRIARREGREPNRAKWSKAVKSAFIRAVERTAAKVTGTEHSK